jgi:hypothetical protein
MSFDGKNLLRSAEVNFYCLKFLSLLPSWIFNIKTGFSIRQKSTPALFDFLGCIFLKDRPNRHIKIDVFTSILFGKFNMPLHRNHWQKSLLKFYRHENKNDDHNYHYRIAYDSGNAKHRRGAA